MACQSTQWIGTGTFSRDLELWLRKCAAPSANPLFKIGQTDHGNREERTIMDMIWLVVQ